MAQERRVVISSPSQLLCCAPYTTYYSNLFVLKTTVAINEQQAEIAFSEDGELTLNCRDPSTKCLILNYHTISAELEGIFRKHGVNRVNNSWCESALYFQVSFLSQESVWNFFHSQKEMEIELSTFLSRHLPVSEKASCSPLVCEVDTELFLIIVDTQKKDAWVEAVGEANYSTCLTLWKESRVFDFGSLFQEHQSRPRRDLLNDPLTLVQLLSELADVVEWFSLGLYLGVPEPELLKIEADDRGSNQGRTERCKMALFSWWLKNGELSWSAVVRALVKIKMTKLARKVALKYSVSMLQASELDQSSIAELPATTQEDQGKEAELITAASSLDTEMRKKVSLGKRRAQATQKLAESSSKIRRLTTEWDEGMRELEKKEQDLNLYTRLQQELATQKDVERLKVKIARKEEKIKQLKAQLDRVEKELNQAREECKQQREWIQQTTVELAVQCEKTRNLNRTVAELKRERKEKDQQLMLLVAENQVLRELHTNIDKEVDSLKQEIKEKNSMIRTLSSQLEVKKAEEKELEEGQLAQMAAEISDLKVRLEEAKDGKMRAEEELKDLQYGDNRPESTMQQVVATLRDNHQVSYQHEDVQTCVTEDIASDDDTYDIDINRSDGVFWSRHHSQGGGFGFSITGGAEYNVPLRVLEIVKGGAAGKDGRLRVNDELLEINGHLTKGMLYSNAMTIFKGSGDILKLVVRRVPEQTSSTTARRNTLQQSVDPFDNLPTYADPRHEEAIGTHDLYVVPKRNSKKKPAPDHEETEYQVPETTQCQPAPEMRELYTVTDQASRKGSQKKPKKPPFDETEYVAPKTIHHQPASKSWQLYTGH